VGTGLRRAHRNYSVYDITYKNLETGERIRDRIMMRIVANLSFIFELGLTLLIQNLLEQISIY
jgi:hypothetical protein